MSEKNKLEFTGERFTPECVREIWYEHYHRYAFARSLVANKNVLDAACGEGYGSHILSAYAQSVEGVDIDSTSIAHAQGKYTKDNLSFTQASCTELPFAENQFDVVVSFETLEHLAEQEEMLSEFQRVLKPNGLLLISTPDKKYYSDEAGFTNEFHVKELYKHEFKELLDTHWSHQKWYSQALSFQSVLESENHNGENFSYDILQEDGFDEKASLNLPKYHVVIASESADFLTENIPSLHLFSDREQSVYEHYNEMVREYISVAEKFMALNDRHEKWLNTPILGKILRYIERKS